MTKKSTFFLKIASCLLVSIFISCQNKEAKPLDLNKSDTINKSLDHPKLILTAQGVKDIRAQLGSIPVFDNTLKKVKEEVDVEIALGIDTPIPVDYSGGLIITDWYGDGNKINQSLIHAQNIRLSVKNQYGFSTDICQARKKPRKSSRLR